MSIESTERVLTSKRLMLVLSCYFLLHLSVALSLNWGNMRSAMFSLDSMWYQHIARHGYVANPDSTQAAESVYAFFPAWPLLLRAASVVWPKTVPLTFLGALLAAGLFTATVLLMNRRKEGDPEGLTPHTPLGLWCLIFAPGAWVFFSNHTEALFLLLTWGAFTTAARDGSRRGLVTASILAGLAALTRNQGTIAALFVGLALATRAPHARARERVRIFVFSGLISGAFYLTWPLFQWLQSGNPFMSVVAQKNWRIVQDMSEYFQNFFWFSANNFWRALTFWGCLALGGRLAYRSSSSRPLGLYVLSSTLLWPLQSNNFPQAYRFSAVLFPFWFCLGDGVARYLERWHRGAVAKQLVRVAFLIAATILSSAYYTRVRWAY